MKPPKPVRKGLYPQLFTVLAQGERAGLPLEQSLRLCGEIAPTLPAVTRAAWQRINSGASLAEAGRRSGLWSGAEYEVIKAGEAGGGLTAVFERLADYHQQRQADRQRARSGLIMPAILLLASILIPPIPQLASGALSPSGYLLRALQLTGSLVLLLAIGYRLPGWLRSGSLTRVAFDRLQVTIPLAGAWYFRRQMREFVTTLALLLAAGIPAYEAVELATPGVNSEVQRRVNLMSLALAGGADFTQALSAIEGINEQALAMALSGESAGRLDEMLQRYSDFETEVTRRQERQLTTWLPRLLYLLVVGWVGWQMVAGALV